MINSQSIVYVQILEHWSLGCIDIDTRSDKSYLTVTSMTSMCCEWSHLATGWSFARHLIKQLKRRLLECPSAVPKPTNGRGQSSGEIPFQTFDSQRRVELVRSWRRSLSSSAACFRNMMYLQMLWSYLFITYCVLTYFGWQRHYICSCSMQGQTYICIRSHISKLHSNQQRGPPPPISRVASSSARMSHNDDTHAAHACHLRLFKTQ